MNDVRATLTAKLGELDEEMAAMSKTPSEQGSISFGKRIGEGTSMAVDRLAQVAPIARASVTAGSPQVGAPGNPTSTSSMPTRLMIATPFHWS